MGGRPGGEAWGQCERESSLEGIAWEWWGEVKERGQRLPTRCAGELRAGVEGEGESQAGPEAAQSLGAALRGQWAALIPSSLPETRAGRAEGHGGQLRPTPGTSTQDSSGLS